MRNSRRDFLKTIGSCAGGLSAYALGFSLPRASAQETREYKLTAAHVTRNNCTYCSVGCGLLMYSRSDNAKNARASIFHIEGDPDHPVSRGSLCPKGSGLIDFIHSENRLLYPTWRAPGSKEWKRISWDEATTRIARLLKKDRDAHFQRRNEVGELVNRWTTTGMLASSAASSETGYIDYKFARSLGMVALDCQARLCHGPTVAALGSTLGRGAMTNNWVDIKNADTILIMGGNPAEAHPVGFKWVMEAKLKNKATVIDVDPRFNRTAAVSDFYAPIRAGSDAAFLLGVIRYLLTTGSLQHEYVRQYTNAAFVVRKGYSFKDGMFSGYSKQDRAYDRSSWAYERGSDNYAVIDTTMNNPRCVINLLRKHVSAYTPQEVSRITGTPVDDFLYVCKQLAETASPHKTATILFALGWTHHTNGSQIIRAAAIIQLLLGNVGMAGGGLNALRGHSNIQGYTDLGLLSQRLPGYMNLPRDDQQNLQTWLDDTIPESDRPDEINFKKNTPAFFVSLMKTLWGKSAKEANHWRYDWLPKWDRGYDMLAYFDMMYRGKVNGYIAQGFNPLAAMPDKNRIQQSLSKLSFLVTIDPLDTETANFWQNEGPFNDVKPEDIKTEVFRLPSSCFAEENGSVVSSARWLQWHYAGAKPPGEAWHDGKIIGTIFHKLRELYRREGGAFPEPILNMRWDYRDPQNPEPEECAREINGVVETDVREPRGTLLLRRGQQISHISQLRDDGSTSSFCWVYCGAWTQQGNMMARRDNTDTGLGITPGWAWAWPANRRIMYNRASLDKNGVPWDPKRTIISWDGQAWVGSDVPDYPAVEPPWGKAGPFIMNSEGVGLLFCTTKMADGPFPAHYEPEETPIPSKYMGKGLYRNPVARLLPDDKIRMGDRQDFPYVGTTYSITELFRHWTKQSRINAITQPEQFVEIGDRLADKLHIRNGERVRVSSKRGYIEAKAVVTKRLKQLDVMGEPLEQVGIPCHWGFKGVTKKGYLANTLTPQIGDANSQTPEFKAFLVNVTKI